MFLKTATQDSFLRRKFVTSHALEAAVYPNKELNTLGLAVPTYARAETSPQGPHYLTLL